MPIFRSGLRLAAALVAHLHDRADALAVVSFVTLAARPGPP